MIITSFKKWALGFVAFVFTATPLMAADMTVDKLTVNRNVIQAGAFDNYFTGQIRISNSYPLIIMRDTNETGNPLSYGAINYDNGSMIFRRYDANTAEIVRLFLMTPDGKVGFNNNNPQYRVDVGGNMRVGTDLVVNNNLNVANDVNIAGDVFTTGETKTAVLEITGGSDLSEKFNILPAATQDKVEPGMVVAIDPARPGALKVASSPYDTKVAGIVSGAGGVRTGMLLGQADHALVNGEFPVALSGRVYCFADATHGAIQPGDLLTSSATPGHAMKAADSARAQGAILGKAMTGLDKGKGLVLVLVNLH